jgi:hypothetical protein
MNRRMFVYLLIVASVGFYFGCQQKAAPGRVVAKINDYLMTDEDIKDKMLHSPYSREVVNDLDEFLDIAVREQVLIQEAQRQGLDKQKTFMKTIERYWAQTLIKELLDKQSQKILQGVSPDKRDAAMEVWVSELYKKADIKIYKKALDEMKQSK